MQVVNAALELDEDLEDRRCADAGVGEYVVPGIGPSGHEGI